MKKDIHPTYYKEAKITCACGNTQILGSTMQVMTVEICSSCHPFYTGKKRLMDTAGMVEKFEARAKKTKVMQEHKPRPKEAVPVKVKKVKASKKEPKQ